MKSKKGRKRKAKTFIDGFKDFITKGNIIDLAIGVIIGGAFSKIVTSLVNDIIMPPIGVLLGGVDFRDLVWQIKAEETNSLGEVINAAVNIRYGNFIMIVLEFLIIGFTIYAVLTLVIRRREFIKKIEAQEKAELEAQQKKEEKEKPKEVVVPEDILLLREIRDTLKQEKGNKNDKW